VARLLTEFKNTLHASLMTKLGFDNIMQAPRISKVVLNMGVGEATRDKKVLDAVVTQLTSLSGQKAVQTFAKNSIAGFKLREGMPIGAKVTLRKSVMYEFLDRLVNVSLPRIRDFRGLKKRSFDGMGNYSFGIKEQIIFPEIDYDR